MSWKCVETKIDKKYTHTTQKFGFISCLVAKNLKFTFDDFLFISNDSKFQILKVYVDSNLEILSKNDFDV
jgi:hypothetical protein